MTTAITKYLEEVLRDYPQSARYIDHCEHQMIFETTNGQVMANDITMDRYLRRLKENQRAVHDCLERSDIDTKQVIRTLYFNSGQRLTLRDAAIQLTMSVATVSRKRKRFLENLSKRLGLSM